MLQSSNKMECKQCLVFQEELKSLEMNLEVNKIMVDELLKDSNRNEQNLGEVKKIQQMERQNFWLKGELNATEINSSCDRKRITDLKAEIE